jgi:hypothetical protein
MSLRPVKTAAVVAALGCVCASVIVAAPSQALPAVGRDPAVITEWNAIAERTISVENATPVPASPLFFAFTSIAMHDAVAAIDGDFETFFEQPRAKAHASPEVAAATAAHRVLRHYYPGSATNLDRDYAAFLAESRNGVGEVHGIRVGRTAADAVISARADDDFTTPHPVTMEPGIGVWEPTPPATAPAASWLGFVAPFVLESSTSIPLPGPDPVDSAEYAVDYAEVKAKGALNGSTRTDDETATALFYSVSAGPVVQYNAAMRTETAERGLDIGETARAFALLDTAISDANISCWKAKVDYAFWRPAPAIRTVDDGNPATVPDPSWVPFIAAPPYPDYPSGHACVTGSASGVFAHLFGAGSIEIDVPSYFEGRPARHYATASALDTETMNARIWLGIHFRQAMTDGNMLGHLAADAVTSSAFVPLD